VTTHSVMGFNPRTGEISFIDPTERVGYCNGYYEYTCIGCGAKDDYHEESGYDDNEYICNICGGEMLQRWIKYDTPKSYKYLNVIKGFGKA